MNKGIPKTELKKSHVQLQPILTDRISPEILFLSDTFIAAASSRLVVSRCPEVGRNSRSDRVVDRPMFWEKRALPAD